MDNLQQLLDSLQHMSAEDAVQTLLQSVLEKGMTTEREIFLKSQPSNKANGFYNRNVNWGSKKLNLDVPRDRQGDFRSFLLPDVYQRNYAQSYDDILNSLLVNGYSKSQLMNTLQSLRLPYNEEEVTKLTDSLHEESKLFRERELESDYLAVYIDGYVCEIKTDTGIHRHVIYVAIGINKEGKKDLLGYYATSGYESKDTWKEVFNDLVNRGIKRISLIVSDDLTGLSDVIAAYFPKTHHQLCLVHLQRNIMTNLPKDIAKNLKGELHSIKASRMSVKEALAKFDLALSAVPDRFKTYKQYLYSKRENYFQFLHYPKNVQKFLCTTNTAENFNSVIEKIRIRSGGYFQSTDYIFTNLYLLQRRLKGGKWCHAAPLFKESLYELIQTFNIQFS